MNHYYKNGLLVATVSCDWKCLRETNLPLDICQNSHTCNMETKTIEVSELVKTFEDNLMSDCVIFAGLEPLLQIEEILNFINAFRETNNEDIVIYTGYNEDEILDSLELLKKYNNIIVKFGRFVPDGRVTYDEVLKIKLISENQYAKIIS